MPSRLSPHVHVWGCPVAMTRARGAKKEENKNFRGSESSKRTKQWCSYNRFRGRSTPQSERFGVRRAGLSWLHAARGQSSGQGDEHGRGWLRTQVWKSRPPSTLPCTTVTVSNLASCPPSGVWQRNSSQKAPSKTQIQSCSFPA